MISSNAPIAASKLDYFNILLRRLTAASHFGLKPHCFVTSVRETALRRLEPRANRVAHKRLRTQRREAYFVR